mgnify:CR=1 FL=1
MNKQELINELKKTTTELDLLLKRASESNLNITIYGSRFEWGLSKSNDKNYPHIAIEISETVKY